MDEYVREFVDETEEAITRLNNQLLALERSPDDGEVLQEIFRTAHTLKGNAGAMGLDRASDLAHAMEDLLDGIRAGTVEVTPDRMDTLFAAVDCLETMVDELAVAGTIRTDPAETIATLREPLADDSADVAAPADDELAAILARFSPPSNPDHDAYLVRMAIADSAELNNGLVVTEALIDAFDLIGTDPSRTAIENEEHGTRIDAVFGAAVGKSAISAALEPVDAVEDFSIRTVTDLIEDASEDSEGFSPLDEDLSADISSDEANDMTVDDLLDEFTELDDIDALADDIDDVSEFEDIGDAGSFDDIIPETSDEAAADSATADAAEGAESPTESESVEDAGAVFEELKQEVDMVGFDELQDELDELEFDEFDEEEIGMDELLGDDVDVDDPAFLDVEEAGPVPEGASWGEAASPEEPDDAPAADSGSPAWVTDASAEPDTTAPAGTSGRPEAESSSSPAESASRSSTEDRDSDVDTASVGPDDEGGREAESLVGATESPGSSDEPAEHPGTQDDSADGPDVRDESTGTPSSTASSDEEAASPADSGASDESSAFADDLFAADTETAASDAAPADSSSADDVADGATDESPAELDGTDGESDETDATVSAGTPSATDDDSAITAPDSVDADRPDFAVDADFADSDEAVGDPLLDEGVGDESDAGESGDPVADEPDPDAVSPASGDEASTEPVPTGAGDDESPEPATADTDDDTSEPATADAEEVSADPVTADTEVELSESVSAETADETAEPTAVDADDTSESETADAADEPAEPVPTDADAADIAGDATADRAEAHWVDDFETGDGSTDDSAEDDVETVDAADAVSPPEGATDDDSVDLDPTVGAEGGLDTETAVPDESTEAAETDGSASDDESVAFDLEEATDLPHAESPVDGDDGEDPISNDGSDPAQESPVAPDSASDPAPAEDGLDPASDAVDPSSSRAGTDRDDSPPVDSESTEPGSSEAVPGPAVDDEAGADDQAGADENVEDLSGDGADTETADADDAVASERDGVEPATTDSADSAVEEGDASQSDARDPFGGEADAFDLSAGLDDLGTEFDDGSDQAAAFETETQTSDVSPDPWNDESGDEADGSDADSRRSEATDESVDVDDEIDDSVGVDAVADFETDLAFEDASAPDSDGAFESDSLDSEGDFDSAVDSSATGLTDAATSFSDEESTIDTSGTDFDGSTDEESDSTDDVLAALPEMEIPDIDVPTTAELETDTDLEEHAQSVRVDREQIDSLLQLVEGLVTSRVRLRTAVDDREPYESIERELEDLEDFTSELQETVMDVRLVPLQTVTNRLPRVVRDLAREQDKQVTFDQSNADVELDRGILDRIGDPLIHLVRNAIDHGIEETEAREEAGKPPEGTIELSAERTQNRVRIEISDDGSGLEADRLRDAAVEADILSREEADELSDGEAYDLVFHSGLSTADEVTDVSGRGVGMDVVRRTIDELNGTVSIDSDSGQGTTVRMTLPVSVAVDDVLFVESGGEQFGIPVDVVREVGDGAHVAETDEGLVFDRGDETLPVIDLGTTLETGDSEIQDPDGMVVRIRDDVRDVGLRCDVVHARREVVVNPFEGFMRSIPGVSGATVRGRGEVITILDVSTL